MQTTFSTSSRRDLGEGLVLRWSTAEDAERIATLLSMAFREKAEEPPNTNVMRTAKAATTTLEAARPTIYT